MGVIRDDEAAQLGMFLAHQLDIDDVFVWPDVDADGPIIYMGPAGAGPFTEGLILPPEGLTVEFGYAEWVPPPPPAAVVVPEEPPPPETPSPFDLWDDAYWGDQIGYEDKFGGPTFDEPYAP